MRPISEIIIHCAATKPEWMDNASMTDKVSEIKRWHTSLPNNWSDIGYHYLIDRDGTVADGRDVARVGAHVKGHNTGTIGVCLLGGHGSAETDKFAEHFTPKQDAALRSLVKELQLRFPAINTISGHNQYAAKACPGFYVPDWIKEQPLASVKPALPEAKSPSGWAALVAAILSIFKRKPK